MGRDDFEDPPVLALLSSEDAFKEGEEEVIQGSGDESAYGKEGSVRLEGNMKKGEKERRRTVRRQFERTLVLLEERQRISCVPRRLVLLLKLARRPHRRGSRFSSDGRRNEFRKETARVG